MPYEEGLERVIDSAKRLGVQLDEQEAREWIKAMSAEATGGDLVVDVDSGVFGHRATLLDLSPGELARFRRLANIVGFEDRPNLTSVLALSGSAAQSRIHAYPADADFFERVHITAPTRELACAVLADAIREKALATMAGPTHRLWEVKFGTFQVDVRRDGQLLHKGAPMSWSPREIEASEMNVELADGTAFAISWADAAREPGWCKLDWVVADPERGQLANASNMLDPTWEAPDGEIVPLDGFLDPYFQEVYLETESLPLFKRIVKDLATDAVDDYVAALEKEVTKYVSGEANWGKVARRLYNIFRLTGHYPEAAYIRELFDEPMTQLYQVAALIRTLDEAAEDGSPFDPEILVAQTDQLIMSAISALEGDREQVVVGHLLRLRDQLSGRRTGDRDADIEGVRETTMAAVNEYFHERLVALPAVKEYVERLSR
ncbi:MAG TPA: hypothetical protein VMP67_09910 [Candidatus Limnocylindria bacterium]|nr:hypothetical protein [Candidatus Limnocylindria bacterium]